MEKHRDVVPATQPVPGHTRRRTVGLLAALGAVATLTSGAEAGKRKRKKRKQPFPCPAVEPCPVVETCPNRTCCACSDGSCRHLPRGTEDPRIVCNAECARLGFAASGIAVSVTGASGTCGADNQCFVARCPLV
ncbi:MAG: hypothetical protein QM692_20645 [Thermomicrobiales bacterium]